MTMSEITTIVHAHACRIEGVRYRFALRSIIAMELEEPAGACALLHVDVTVANSKNPLATLAATAPLSHPAHIPMLLTCGLHEHLHTLAARRTERRHEPSVAVPQGSALG
jgi:hypothetical protein